MTDKILALGKTARPLLSGVLHRERLFRLLDDAGDKRVFWIVGPGGSGKTALAASYLDSRKHHCIWYRMDGGDADPATFFYCVGQTFAATHPRSAFHLPLLTSEYLQDIGAFALRFFEDIFSHFKAPHALVLDNYHELPPDSVLHEVLAAVLEALPDQMRVILVSRAEPPAAYSRLRANRHMAIIGADQLRFTPEETRAFAAREHADAVTTEQLDYFQTITDGWAAGLVLLLEHFRTRNFAPGCLNGIAPDEVFDYFAGEVFAKIPETTRHFLLATALLPRMTAGLARELSGDPHAARTLRTLSRSNFFTSWHAGSDPVYSYHPLFRQFLLSRGTEQLPPRELRELRRHAAQLLDAAGWADDAVELYRDDEELERLTALIVGNAAAFVAQGRSMTVAGWLERLPEGTVAAQPWLLYWQGRCSMDRSLGNARRSFRAALELFDRQGDGGGAFLAWAGAVDSYFYEMREFGPLDEWLAHFAVLEQRYPRYPNRDIEIRTAASVFTALVLRQNDHEGIVRWGERLSALLDTSVDPHIRLHVGLMRSVNYIWTGDYRRNRMLLESLHAETAIQRDAQPLMRVTLCALKALHSWLTTDVDGCLDAVALGRETAREHGIHVWDHLFRSCIAEAAILADDRPMLREALAGMRCSQSDATAIDRFSFHLLSAWDAWLEENLAEAFAHMDQGRDWVMRIDSRFHEGLWHLGMGALLTDRGRHDEALTELDRALELCRSARGRSVEYMALLVRARARFARGEDGPALEDLRRGLAIGCDEDYSHFFWWRSADMADLCARALEAGIETGYVLRLIRRRDLVPSEIPLAVEKWPWQIRIFTLGRFEVELRGAALTFSGKAQKKPLELLKALVSLGGSSVPQNLLSEALWPDQDEDLALKSLKATLHRLRLLLGNEGIIRVQDGMVSLERRHVWIDAWAFEAVLDRARRKWDEGRAGEALQLTDKAIALYRGQYLAADTSSHWTYRLRERLRARFLGKAGLACQHLQRTGNMGKAIDCYQRVLEVDDLAEEFYRRLMQCHLAAGNRPEAVKVYERCRFILARELGIKPSPQTDEIYRQAREE